MSLQISTRLFSRCTAVKRAVTDFSRRKEGTGSGPFVELPDVQPLHDSILLRLPSSSSVIGKLNNITVINSSHELKDVDLKHLFAVEKHNDGFMKLSTGDEPVNLICTSSNALGRVSLLNIDDYAKGWTLLDPIQNILCYSGDITVDANSITGRGIVAINGSGPTWELQIGDKEELLLPARSLLAYSPSINIKWEKNAGNSIFDKTFFPKPTWLSIPVQLSQWYSENIKGHYDSLRLKMNKYFQRHKFMARIAGPGLVIVQSRTNKTKQVLYGDKDIMNALNRE